MFNVGDLDQMIAGLNEPAMMEADKEIAKLLFRKFTNYQNAGFSPEEALEMTIRHGPFGNTQGEE